MHILSTLFPQSFSQFIHSVGSSIAKLVATVQCCKGAVRFPRGTLQPIMVAETPWRKPPLSIEDCAHEMCAPAVGTVISTMLGEFVECKHIFRFFSFFLLRLFLSIR